MGLQTNGKFVHQEFRYIKIPDRRLLSGLLYVNVVNHNANDDQDDFMQQCHDHAVSNGIKYSSSFSENGTAFTSFQDRGREEMKHSFADYDCFVFHVAGGMTLSGGIMSPTTTHTTYSGSSLSSDLHNNGFASSGTWVDGSGSLGDLTGQSWTTLTNTSGENPFGDACSHFLKYHLLSRINNASGHGLYQTDQPQYFKHRAMHKQTYNSPSNSATHNTALPVGTVTNEYVLSNGIYDDTDSHGTDLGMASYATIGHGGSTNFQRLKSNVRNNGETQASDGDLTEKDGETYYSPVDTVKIYGKHHLVIESHNNGIPIGQANHRTIYCVKEHITTFWDLVIDIGLRGNNPAANTANGAAAQTDSDKSILRPQINVSFQPFGETASFDISETPHTS